MAWYGKMDVFKSFWTQFSTYEMDNYVTSYESMKFEKMGKQNCKISQIDRTTLTIEVYKQTQNPLLHIWVSKAQNDQGDLCWMA